MLVNLDGSCGNANGHRVPDRLGRRLRTALRLGPSGDDDDPGRSKPGGPLRWGLIPFWAKDAKIAYSTINAMAETVSTKPAFREAFKSLRCLVPADGYYEWKKIDAKTKQPYRFSLGDDSLFAFAGLWERWNDRASGETVRSFTIITGDANQEYAHIHNRMPVILDRSDYARWLGEEHASKDELLQLLRALPGREDARLPDRPADRQRQER